MEKKDDYAIVIFTVSYSESLRNFSSCYLLVKTGGSLQHMSIRS